MASRKDVYTDEQRDEIVAHVLVNVAAGRAVTTILKEDEGLCAETTFWRWYFNDDELREKLARARENGVEARLEQAVHMAMTPMMGEIVTYERDPELQKDIEDGQEPTSQGGDPYEGMICKVKKEDMLGHRRLVVDTLIKSAQMLKPKTYGPRLDLTSDNKPIGVAAELEAARLRARDLLDGKSK